MAGRAGGRARDVRGLSEIDSRIVLHEHPPQPAHHHSPGIAAPHPRGLYILFLVEMWERFSFYGMRALLVLYLTKSLLYPRSDALELFGRYTALAYLTPLAGGYLSDRLLGPRAAVILGGLFMSAGHFAMAFPDLLTIALTLIVIGNGFFKPNVSTLVGTLYARDDIRRDGAYTLFYMGINLGAFLAPLVCGTLGERYGWHYGFGAAGVGMLFGLGLLLANGGSLAPAEPSDSRRSAAASDAPLTAGDWKRIAAIVTVSMFSAFFWLGFEQAGGTMTLFADERVDLTRFGFAIPASWFQSVNPLAVMLLAPLVGGWWERRGVNSFTKVGVGLLLLGGGFVIMSFAGAAADRGLVSPLWLVSVYVVFTLGELCLSPVGLSLVNRLAPARVAGLMMAVWFLSSSFSNYLGGYLERLLAGAPVGLTIWQFLTLTSFGAGTAIVISSSVLSKLSETPERPS